MTDLYLIAHKVRSAPAFDIAAHLECPECLSLGCPECDDLGYWWVIPTSGHRAYPYWSDPLQWYMDEMCDIPPMPDAFPDHYPTRATPTVSLAEALGIHPAPSAPIVRRF